MKRLFAAVAVVAVVGISIAYSIRSTGQQAPSQVQRSTVNVVHVKPDMVDAWIDFQTKQTIPALKKAGVTQRDVYQSAYGPSFEFRIVTPLAKFADRDNPSPIERALGAAGAKEYQDAYRKLLASQEINVIQAVADASYDPDPNGEHRILVLTRSHVAPGRGAEYLAYLRNDIVPLQGRAQVVKRYLVNQVILGGDANEYRTATYMDKFADLEGGTAAQRVLGQEAAAKLTQKTAGIVLRTERSVYIRNDTLSFRSKPTS